MRKILLFSLLLLALPFIIRPGFAQCASTAPLTTPGAEGLISGKTITGLDNAGGNCIYGSPAPVNLETAKILKDYSTRDYTGFKTTFYDKTKFRGTKGILFNGALPKFSGVVGKFPGDGLYLNGVLDLTLETGNLPNGSGIGTEVIFVDGDLSIKNNISYHTLDSTGGLVFVVGGKINIYTNVDQIDAVLISFGDICSAWDSVASACTTPFITPTGLTINGSLISLGGTGGSIKLVRSLSPNDRPAEIINAQPKYLKLLTVDDLMDEDLIIPYESQ